jgi:hypothetical protein
MALFVLVCSVAPAAFVAQTTEPPHKSEAGRILIVGLPYVWVPPGTFEMGCSPGDNDCFDEEKLSLANCYFAQDSLGFPILLRFCDAESGRSFHPPHRPWPGCSPRIERLVNS